MALLWHRCENCAAESNLCTQLHADSILTHHLEIVRIYAFSCGCSVDCGGRCEVCLTSVVAVAQSLRSQGQTRVHLHTQHVSDRCAFVLVSLLGLSVLTQQLDH